MAKEAPDNDSPRQKRDTPRPKLAGSDFDAVPDEEKIHYYRCADCQKLVDKRQLDDVLYHQDHKQRPDIPYSGLQRLS